MPSFEELFRGSGGLPIIYKGQVVQLVDTIPVAGSAQIRVVFESTNSHWKQGVHLSTNGTFEVNGQTIAGSILLWENTAPACVSLQVNSTDGKCFVKNVWDVGDGVVHSWHNGAAMVVENCGAYRRYRCNDGRDSDDLNDLVIRIESLTFAHDGKSTDATTGG